MIERGEGVGGAWWGLGDPEWPPRIGRLYALSHLECR